MFLVVKFSVYLNRRVFVMAKKEVKGKKHKSLKLKGNCSNSEASIVFARSYNYSTFKGR